jgi:RNA polymerase sigma-70 factor (ECF subfamily)
VGEAPWIGAALASARPQAVAALLRYFRDLDRAEEAFQEACVRALRAWPASGPPRDPTAWLILAGRNYALDELRKGSRHRALLSEAAMPEPEDPASTLPEQLDDAHYRDDVLRLLFTCCHPELPAAQQIALALRVVSGLSVAEIARAFLVSESAMEQRITRAKRRISQAGVEFGTVAAMIYLLFNEGYSASGGSAHVRAPLCEEGIRLARLLLGLFHEPEIMGLTALFLLQHARVRARLDAHGAIVLLEHQDRALWDRAAIDEGLALLEKARRHGRPGPYQLQAELAAAHARAGRPEETDWAAIERAYAELERLQPSPVVTLNRAVAVAKLRGPATALALVEPLAERLDGYFHFHGVRGALLLDLGRSADARAAFERAIGLARTAAEAEHVRAQLGRIDAELH